MNYYYYTLLSNWIFGFDKYNLIYSKKLIPQSTFTDEFYFVDDTQREIGFQKANNTLIKNQTKDTVICIQMDEGATGVDVEKNLKNGKGFLIRQNWFIVKTVFLCDEKDIVGVEKSVEDIFALSYHLVNKDKNYSNAPPRTISALPIALACQASCNFCYSESSISLGKKKKIYHSEKIEKYLVAGKEMGAERFVITGGGEPGLLLENELLKLISLGKKYFNKNILITNGMFLSLLSEAEVKRRVRDLKEAGLTHLCISRHHFDQQENTKIMGVNTKTENLLKHLSTFDHGLTIRLICVIQKLGIGNVDLAKKYIDFAFENNVEQVCFKELYVGSQYETLYHSKMSNITSLENQVKLKTIIKAVSEMNGIEITSLPWGSPVFKIEKESKTIQVAAYTEPSVGWELKNNLARSWNIMADYTCYASLEDEKSLIVL